MCVLACVLSAVGFQQPDGCINKYALKDFFENSRYGKDTMDEAEVQNYLKALDRCAWEANAKKDGLTILEEEVQTNDLKFSIPTSMDAVQDMVMDGISEIFEGAMASFQKKPIIAIKCRRAAHLFNCLDVQVKIDANASSPAGGARESWDEYYIKKPHMYY